jgi:16S rRNA (cytidine1402-2'-O)-methyltransferase
MTTPGKLYLIPNVISEGTHDVVIALQVREAIKSLRFFLAEDVRTARRYFSNLHVFETIESLQFETLNKDTKESDLPTLMKPLLEGHDLGIISEAGCPGVADPGALAANYAHQNGIQVIPLVGPSSILLALMASGLNGQHFAFHGYLPIESREAVKSIKELERESRLKNQTQIFIETPYRNNGLIQNLIKSLDSDTTLCIAMDLTSANEQIISKSVRDWRKERIDLPKSPAIFLFLA